MGPHASANFLNLYHRALNHRGVYEDTDFPRIIYLGLPLTEWGVTGALDKDAVASQVKDGLRWLKDAGAELIAIPCNSVHEFHGEASATLGVPVLNIVTESLRITRRKPLGVLCSAQARAAGLYERCGSAIMYLRLQGRIDAMIGAVIHGNAPSIDCLIDELRAVGAGTVVLGCTELSVCRWTPAPDLVDSTRALAGALAALT